MADLPTPDEIRRATFRVVFRGFDQGEVSSHLERLAAAVEELSEERDRLYERLGEFAERDLRREFESVGQEVSAVLEAARSAAESMRERASSDAARWRSEAQAEAETMRREALADAESMRSDAWTTGTQLLEQVQAEVERQRADNEQGALAIRGEAEREAHRLTASARREADEVLRAAKMEAERMVARAQGEHDEIIATAQRQAEAAQERARALEERRRELMDELESVRSALSSVEGELEERRQGIGLAEPPDLPGRVVIAGDEGPEVKDWEEGATVRVIRPGRSDDEEAEESSAPGPPPVAKADDVADADSLAEEVARIRSREEEPVVEQGEEPPEESGQTGEEPEAPTAEPEDEPAVIVEPEKDTEESTGSGGSGTGTEPASAPSEASGPEPTGDRVDDLSELFRRLRQPADDDREEAEMEAPTDEPDEISQPVSGSGGSSNGSGPHLPEGVDPFETRERLLLPITNATLRAVKRELAEAQNQALESLRVNQGEWVPDRGGLDAAFREDLETLVDQASQAGVEAAIEMGLTGLGSLSPDPPAPDDVGDELAGALTSALESAGAGARERQAAVSRVFRGWRTDEAERRIRSVALLSYHAALRQALEAREKGWEWVAAGRLCPACRQASENHEAVPPVHRDCQCTIVPA